MLKRFSFSLRVCPSLARNAKVAGSLLSGPQKFVQERPYRTGTPSPLTAWEVSAHQQKQARTDPPSPRQPAVASAAVADNRVRVRWDDGTESRFPLLWLRDNCQCDRCYSRGSIARRFLMDRLLEGVAVASAAATSDGGLKVGWTDGHVSPYSKEWLNGRKFEEKERDFYRNVYNLPKKFWNEDYQPTKYDYKTLMHDDKMLFDFLVDVEQNGAALLKDVPKRPASSMNLTERIGRVQATHYGDYSSVEVQDDPENVSYSNFSLNLHNDLPQYVNQPGIIFLHMLKQHRGLGGDTTISDGFRAAEELRATDAAAFKALTEKKVYFLAKGIDTNYDGKMRHFFKINKTPVIELDSEGEVKATHFNNQGRESHMDMGVEEAEEHYRALLLYYSLLKKHTIGLRLEDGDLAVIDNIRCQHGREGFTGSSERHLVTTYMSWDEALCCRRRLHENFNGRIV